MSPKKNRGNTDNSCVHRACCKHHGCCWPHDSALKPSKKTLEDLAEERRLLMDLQTQERAVTKVLDNIRMMKLYNEDTDAKLKKNLKLEKEILKHAEQFRFSYNYFQDKLFQIELSHILLLSLSPDVMDSNPDLKDLRKASGDAIKLCLVINRKKRMYLLKLIKACSSFRRTNLKLSVDLRDTRLMQFEAEKQVTEMIQHFKSCKDQLTQEFGYDDLIRAHRCLEVNSETLAGIHSKCGEK